VICISQSLTLHSWMVGGKSNCFAANRQGAQVQDRVNVAGNGAGADVQQGGHGFRRQSPLHRLGKRYATNAGHELMFRVVSPPVPCSPVCLFW